MITSRHFQESEFAKATPQCSLQDMNQQTMDKFDRLRDKVGMPLSFSCAYRSPEWDRSKGRSGTGAHTLGQAIDIICSDSTMRLKIVKCAIEVGFNRIGIEGSFVHLDDSTSHSQNVMWTY